jgi:hypothetical protein
VKNAQTKISFSKFFFSISAGSKWQKKFIVCGHDWHFAEVSAAVFCLTGFAFFCDFAFMVWLFVVE